MVTREALDQVPWVDLHHAYGPAEDTPENLLLLQSGDERERGEAIQNLWASICHQGSVYEASCAAVPFLIEILAHALAEQRPPILSLLAGLGHSDWFADRDSVTLQVKHEWPAPATHERWSVVQFLSEGNRYHVLEWMTLAHERVGEGIPLYLDLLRGGHVETRFTTLYVLSGYRERSAEVVSAIAEVIGETADPFVLASAFLALGPLLAAESPLWDQVMSAPLIDLGFPKLAQVAASLALAKYFSGPLAPHAREILGRVRKMPNEQSKAALCTVQGNEASMRVSIR